MGSIEEVCSIGEYVDYARAVHRMDPTFEEEKWGAYPRVSLHDWPAFSLGATLLDSCKKQLAPPGVKDGSIVGGPFRSGGRADESWRAKARICTLWAQVLELKRADLEGSKPGGPSSASLWARLGW